MQVFGTPKHTPLWQASVIVHALLSLQLAPLAYGYVHEPFWHVPGDEKQPLGGELHVTFAHGSVTHVPLMQPPAPHVMICDAYVHRPPLHPPV